MDNKLYYVCKYTPIELLESYGFNLERLDPDLESIECGDSLAHPNFCGYGKSVLKMVEDGQIGRLFLVDCCDVCRRIYDILSAKKEMKFLYLMDLPHKNGSSEQRLMRRELWKLNEIIKENMSKDFDEKRARELWKEGIEKAEKARPKGDHVILTGAHGNASLKDRIVELMQLPVLDDTCSGNRILEGERGDDFFTDYSRALLSQQSPCMRMQFKRPKDPKGVGTISHTIKFCDYYSLQYRDLRSNEDPLVKIETDCTAQSQGQIETRLEAFAEVINPKMITKTSDGNYVAGIDSGSSSTNAVILDENKNIVGYSILATGAGVVKSGRSALETSLEDAGLNEEDISQVISTGYGRNNLELSDSSITEITCHAKGARSLHPKARTVIDIGGQDSKVIVLDEDGSVVNFVMNDKCAAGTGRFLENMSKVLELSLEEMSTRGLDWKKAITISNTCTVFAESEVVSLIANNTELSDIIHGLNQSIATRTAALVRAAKGKPPYIMTGGVSKNVGVVKALESELSEEIYVPEEAQLCGALGAALFALE